MFSLYLPDAVVRADPKLVLLWRGGLVVTNEGRAFIPIARNLGLRSQAQERRQSPEAGKDPQQAVLSLEIAVRKG